jgi:putative ABC transport system substrate-binding protein
MRRRDFIASIWCDCGVAARGASTTACDPGDRVPQQCVPGRLRAHADGISPSLKGNWLCGEPNVRIEYRWAEGQYDQLPAMAADLIHREVAVIVANTPANLAAKNATTRIPIVFTTGNDPVQLGLVASLSRPGGNVTGVTQLTVELAPKRLELAHGLVPAASVIGLLVNPKIAVQTVVVTRDLQTAATNLGLQLMVLQASTEAEVEDAFTTSTRKRVGALVIAADPFFNSIAEKLAALALRHLVPTIFQYHQFVAAGGLASYSGSITDSYRVAGLYTGRILKGEKPADLPVQESTKVELIFNLEFACKLAGAKVVLVMGHTACGAIKGASDNAELGNLTGLLAKIKPAVQATTYAGERSAKNYAFVDAVALKNVEMTVADIRKDSPVLAELEAKGAIKITGAMYNLQTGAVNFFG